MRLLIGNSTNADLTDEDEKRGAAWWAQRLLWFAEDGDVLVMSEHPDPAYLAYVTALTGTAASSLRLVVPPPGVDGTQWLSHDRLTDTKLVDLLTEAFAGREVHSVLALWPDAAVVSLARALGCADRAPGGAFAAQGGGALVNSKAVFRAIAAGAGLPLPPGAVCGSRHTAERAVSELIEQGRPVIVKHEFQSGGVGNEIISPVDGVRPLGAPRVTKAADRAGVSTFLTANWDRLTGGGRHRLVVEEYFPESMPVFAEFLIADDGPQFGAHGQMVYEPVACAQAIPAPGPSTGQIEQVVEHARTLCVALHGIGYRGRLSADAIVTPDGAVYFTEYNGRVTGSTHLYAVLGERVVGPGFAAERLLLERVGWTVPSFEAAAAALREAGLEYDPRTRTGVLFCSAFHPPTSTVWYCVVERDIDGANRTAARVDAMFG